MAVLRIVELASVPLLSGSFFCKWSLLLNGKVFQKGRTES